MKAFPPRHTLLVPLCALAAVASLYVGCSSSESGNPPPGPTDDASTDRGLGGGDTGTDPDADVYVPPPCQLDKPFGAAVPVQGLPADDNFSAHLSNDELTIYFATTGAGSKGSSDIMSAKRNSRSEAFGAIDFKRFDKLNTIGTESDVRLTVDQKTIYFSQSTGAGIFQIYTAKRENVDADFGPAEALPDTVNNAAGVNSHVGAPFPRDGEFWFIGRMGTDGNADAQIFRSTYAPNGELDKGQVVDGVAGGVSDPNGLEHFPVLSADGLTMYFASSRPDGAAGDYDIYTAKRKRIDGAFSDVSRVAGFDTAKFEWPSWVSPDGCRLYVGTGGENGTPRVISVASRPE